MWKRASLLLRNVKVALEMNARLLFLFIHRTILVLSTQGKKPKIKQVGSKKAHLCGCSSVLEVCVDACVRLNMANVRGEIIS